MQSQKCSPWLGGRRWKCLSYIGLPGHVRSPQLPIIEVSPITAVNWAKPTLSLCCPQLFGSGRHGDTGYHSTSVVTYPRTWGVKSTFVCVSSQDHVIIFSKGNNTSSNWVVFPGINTIGIEWATGDYSWLFGDDLWLEDLQEKLISSLHG